SAATAAGLHTYRNTNLDEVLDDVSPAAFENKRRFYEKYRDQLAQVNSDALGAEDKADYTLLQDQVLLGLRDLTEARAQAHSPEFYTRTLSTALYVPFAGAYAPPDQRLQQIIARLQKVPLFLDFAATNIISATEGGVQTAIAENQSAMALVDKEI